MATVSALDAIADILEKDGMKLVYKDGEWSIQLNDTLSVKLKYAYEVMFIHNMNREEFFKSISDMKNMVVST